MSKARHRTSVSANVPTIRVALVILGKSAHELTEIVNRMEDHVLEDILQSLAHRAKHLRGLADACEAAEARLIVCADGRA